LCHHAARRQRLIDFANNAIKPSALFSASLNHATKNIDQWYLRNFDTLACSKRTEEDFSDESLSRPLE